MNTNILGSPSKEERNFAMLSHLLGIFTYFLGALGIWLGKKGDSRFIENESKEALNFQVTMLIGYFIGFGLKAILFGYVILAVMYTFNIIFCLMGAVSASQGKSYRYPLVLRLVS